MAECYTNTTVNIATALGFFSRMCSLQSLEMLESANHLVTALSVESWPGAWQTTQKHIRGWEIGLEAEMGFLGSEAYGLPVDAESFVGSVMANLFRSHYPLGTVWKLLRPSSWRYGDGGGIQPKNTSGQGLLGTQLRTTGSNVASITYAVKEEPGNGAKGTKR